MSEPSDVMLPSSQEETTVSESEDRYSAAQALKNQRKFLERFQQDSRDLVSVSFLGKDYFISIPLLGPSRVVEFRRVKTFSGGFPVQECLRKIAMANEQICVQDVCLSSFINIDEFMTCIIDQKRKTKHLIVRILVCNAESRLSFLHPNPQSFKERFAHIISYSKKLADAGCELRVYPSVLFGALIRVDETTFSIPFLEGKRGSESKGFSGPYEVDPILKTRTEHFEELWKIGLRFAMSNPDATYDYSKEEEDDDDDDDDDDEEPFVEEHWTN